MLKDLKWDYTQEIRKPIVGGSFLLSEPFMEDPFFSRSVCLVCDYNKEEGSFGFIINKLTTQKVSDLNENTKDIDFDLYYGGPVSMDSLYYLHDNSTKIKGALPIAEGLYWSGNFEQIKEHIKAGLLTKDNIRFYLGYSGWDKAQLRKEIINNSWIVSNQQLNIFDDSEEHWEQILNDMGGVYEVMANFPRQANLN